LDELQTFRAPPEQVIGVGRFLRRNIPPCASGRNSKIPKVIAFSGSSSERAATFEFMAAEFPETLLRLLRSSVPSFAAAEVLLSMIEQPGKFWQAIDFTKANEPSANMRQVEDYLNGFRSAGLVKKTKEGYRFGPDSPDLEEAVAALQAAYNERPVTLIRTIYRLADNKIQSFADSFKLREDR
jgi:hypothetical protein